MKLGAALGSAIAGYRDYVLQRDQSGCTRSAEAMVDIVRYVEALENALRNLTFQARTSGGVAGPDEGLKAACDVAEQVLRPTP